jgi:hypothetical protein
MGFVEFVLGIITGYRRPGRGFDWSYSRTDLRIIGTRDRGPGRSLPYLVSASCPAVSFVLGLFIISTIAR